MKNEKETIEKLKEQVNQYKKILESLHEGYLLVDQDALIYDVNAAYCKISGYSRTELMNMKLTDLRSDLSSEKLKKLLHHISESGSRKFETKHRRKDGAVRDLVASASMIQKDGKKFVAGLVRDVTEKKKAHKKLKEAKQRFESLFENNPHPVYYMDLEGNYMGLNSKLEELSGYPKEELLGLNFENLIASEDVAKTKNHFRRAAAGNIEEYEIIGVTREGENTPVKVTNFPMIIDDKIVGVFGIAEDVTQRIKTNQKLVESEQKWQHLVEDNPQPVQVTIDSIIVFINQAGAELYGAQNPEDLIGMSVLSFNLEETQKKIEKRIKRMHEGSPVEKVHSHKIIDQNGKEHFVEVYSILTEYHGQKAVQSVLHDISDLKKKEDTIQASLEEKQILLQEIHHRVKNNMAVISGLLELQAMNTNDEKLKQILKESQLRIHSMAMIHEKLYASESFSKINFNEYVKVLSQRIIDTSASKENIITVRFHLDAVQLNIIQAIPCGLILNELIVNCLKHAFKKQKAGTILIGLVKNDKQIDFFVEDNGCGLPETFSIEQQESLGMKLVQTLTKQLEGQLLIEKGTENLGACFRILTNIK